MPIVRYILKAAIRDRLVLAILVVMAVAASMSLFLGSAAVTEQDQFALVFAAGGLRLAGTMGLVLFIVFYLRRSFDSKDVDYLLSRPIGRTAFLLSHSIAFMLLAAFIATVVSLTVLAMVPKIFGAGYLLWAGSLLIEYIIIANVALFFAMVLPNAAAGTMAVLGFYVLSRIIGQLLGIVEAGVGHLEILGFIMDVIALVIPRLDLMAQTSWLVYGVGDIGLGFVFAQGILFSGLVVLAALVDLVRRQF